VNDWDNVAVDLDTVALQDQVLDPDSLTEALSHVDIDLLGVTDAVIEWASDRVKLGDKLSDTVHVLLCVPLSTTTVTVLVDEQLAELLGVGTKVQERLLD